MGVSRWRCTVENHLAHWWGPETKALQAPPSVKHPIGELLFFQFSRLRHSYTPESINQEYVVRQLK